MGVNHASQAETVEENSNDLKIELYPKNKSRYKFETKPIKEYYPQILLTTPLILIKI